jgi:hypothetical protein
MAFNPRKRKIADVIDKEEFMVEKRRKLAEVIKPATKPTSRGR